MRGGDDLTNAVKIVVYYPDESELYAKLIRAPRSRVVVQTASTRDDVAAKIEDADVLYGWRFPPSVYAKAHRLRWVHAAAAGVEWALVPELPADIVVTRTPGIFGPWMSEYVLGRCLWVTQHMAELQAAQHEHRWRGDFYPVRLGGKTIVVVGLGDIGRTIAAAAHAVGLRVVGVSRSGRPVRGVDRVFRSTQLRGALKQGDVVVLTVPLTPGTRGMIGSRELAAMRPTSWVINIARGAVVDETALTDALSSKRIGGAILDVFAEEPLPADHAFWDMPNVVITPHVSGPSTPEEIAPIFNENLRRFLAGKRLLHVVDRKRGY